MLTGGVDDMVRWMPAHKGTEEAARLRDSRGKQLTEEDVKVNAFVDELAKAAVEEHRVPAEVRSEVGKRRELVRYVAWCIGLAAREANEVGGDGRDAKTFATAQRGEGNEEKKRGRAARSSRSVQLGGHNLRKKGEGWE